MSSDKHKKLDSTQNDSADESSTSTVTTTVEDTTAETQTPDVRADVALSPLEEKVVRMRYGRSLKGLEALEFAPGASMETRLKLALIEATLLEAFEANALEPDPHTGSPRSVLADYLE